MKELLECLEEQSVGLGLEVKGEAGTPATLVLGEEVWETPFLLPKDLQSSDPVRGIVLRHLFNLLLPMEIDAYLGADVITPGLDSIQKEARSFFGPSLYRDFLLTTALHVLALSITLSNALERPLVQGPMN